MRYLRNAWYCLAQTGEINGEPRMIRVFDEPLLVYRAEDGNAVAMSDRCPHRYAPLHQGERIGDTIQCPYHGLEFNRDGKCIHNPHGSGVIPRNADLRTYPLSEKYGLVWIWAGDESRADESLLPDIPCLVPQSSRRIVQGKLHVRANYEMVVDNLMDLTHSGYLHRGSVSVSSVHGAPEPGIEVTEGRIDSTLLTRDVPPPLPFVPMWPKGANCDYHRTSTWLPPSSVKTMIGCSQVGGEVKADKTYMDVYHFLTPETDRSANYHWIASRTYGLDNEAYDEKLAETITRAFATEDEPMIAACQANMRDETNIYAMRPALLETDRACVLVNKQLGQMIKKEATAET